MDLIHLHVHTTITDNFWATISETRAKQRKQMKMSLVREMWGMAPIVIVENNLTKAHFLPADVIYSLPVTSVCFGLMWQFYCIQYVLLRLHSMRYYQEKKIGTVEDYVLPNVWHFSDDTLHGIKSNQLHYTEWIVHLFYRSSVSFWHMYGIKCECTYMYNRFWLCENRDENAIAIGMRYVLR